MVNRVALLFFKTAYGMLLLKLSHDESNLSVPTENWKICFTIKWYEKQEKQFRTRFFFFFFILGLKAYKSWLLFKMLCKAV